MHKAVHNQPAHSNCATAAGHRQAAHEPPLNGEKYTICTVRRAADLLIHHLQRQLSLLELQSLRATCRALRVAVQRADPRLGLTVARWCYARA